MTNDEEKEMAALTQKLESMAQELTDQANVMQTKIGMRDREVERRERIAAQDVIRNETLQGEVRRLDLQVEEYRKALKAISDTFNTGANATDVSMIAYRALKSEKQKADTCENYRDANTNGIKSRFCSAFESNAQIHAPTCQFYKQVEVCPPDTCALCYHLKDSDEHGKCEAERAAHHGLTGE